LYTIAQIKKVWLEQKLKFFFWWGPFYHKRTQMKTYFSLIRLVVFVCQCYNPNIQVYLTCWTVPTLDIVSSIFQRLLFVVCEKGLMVSFAFFLQIVHLLWCHSFSILCICVRFSFLSIICISVLWFNPWSSRKYDRSLLAFVTNWLFKENVWKSKCKFLGKSS